MYCGALLFHFYFFTFTLNFKSANPFRMKKNLLFVSILMFFILSAQSQPPATWQTRGVGGGGALFFPRINPANDNEFYVACDMSEMFHSTNFGDSYTQIHFTKLPAMNV